MQLLSEAIASIILAESSITDITGEGNIWHAKIPQRNQAQDSDNPAETAVFFYTYAVQPNDTKSGQSEVDLHMVRFHVVGDSDETIGQLARYIRLVFDRLEPGVYGTTEIPIDGVSFLNSYFEPDEDVPLEKEQWVLEFQFRVIDNEIRTPGSPSPSFPGFAGNYSTSEQTWPYSRYHDGKRIRWRTWTIGDGIDGLIELDGLEVAETSSIVKADISYKIGTSWFTMTVELQEGNEDYEILTSSDMTDITVTVWWTKTT